jgi:hypothetical protein
MQVILRRCINVPQSEVYLIHQRRRRYVGNGRIRLPRGGLGPRLDTWRVWRAISKYVPSRVIVFFSLAELLGWGMMTRGLLWGASEDVCAQDFNMSELWRRGSAVSIISNPLCLFS